MGRTPRLVSDRGELVLTTSTGRELRSADLVGATLEVGAQVVRLEAVEPDAGSPDRVLLYRFAVVPRRGAALELCNTDPAGERWALAVQSDGGQVELVCSSGAIGKCIRWGYPPWKRSSRGGSAGALHDACVRMVRADYGGDGATATRDGTRIAFCDLEGVRPCARTERDFEAAWSRRGAVCVAQARVPELVGLAALAQRYPRLARHFGPTCTFAAARADERVVLFSWVPR